MGSKQLLKIHPTYVDSVSIHPTYFENLITGLRGAVVEENVLIKSESPYPDTIDSFRLSLLSFSLSTLLKNYCHK
jgi:hypothetical protein